MPVLGLSKLLIVLSVTLLIGISAWLIFFRKTCPSELQGSMPRILESTPNSKLLNVLPRRMFGWGGWTTTMLGYCGECSLQIIATFYGNYISQDQVVRAAGGTFNIGVNDNVCLPALHMQSEFWPNIFGKGDPSIYDILNYVKKQLDAGFPVIAALYCNEDDGDPSYDHQCVFMGYECTDPKYPGQITTLWLLDTYQIRLIPFDCSMGPYHCSSGPDNCPNPVPKMGPPNYPEAPFPRCYKRREDFANPNKQAPYDVAIPNILNVKIGAEDAGSAFLTVFGNEDPNNELFPCWLQMNSCYEPNNGVEDAIGAPPGPISCNVFISGLKGGRSYSLLRFDNPADVPKQGNFLASTGYTYRRDFVACSNGSVKIHVAHDPKVWPFMSNGTYFFRCVETKGQPMKQNFPYGTDRTDVTPVPTPKLWNTQGWRLNRFRDVIQSRLLEWDLKLQNKPRKHGKQAKNRRASASSVTPLQAAPKCPQATTALPAIVCGNADTGSIASLWEWQFPNKTWKGDIIGCMQVTFAVQFSEAEAANCVNFSISNVGDSPPITLNSVTGSIIYNVDGSEPRMYIENVDDKYTYSFSPDPMQQDGSFQMLSQDGVTWSTLRPIQP